MGYYTSEVYFDNAFQENFKTSNFLIETTHTVGNWNIVTEFIHLYLRIKNVKNAKPKF